MLLNCRKRKNPVHLYSVAQITGLLALLAVIGISYVNLSIQLNAKGKLIKQVEAEISKLRTENEILTAKIAHYTSRPFLERQLQRGALSLVPIRTDRLVHLEPERATGVHGLASTTGREALLSTAIRPFN